MPPQSQQEPAIGDRTTAAPVSPTRALAVLVTLSVATFLFVTVEVLPIGLLTLIADDLAVTRSQTGLLVTSYAVVVLLMSVPLTRLTRRVPRRWLLGSTLAVFVAATVVSAVARSYEVLLAGRILTALAHAVFWSVVAAAATGLFAPQVRGAMVARLSIGNALGPVLGVPLGTWIGQQAGWRTAFAAAAVLSVLVCLAVLVLLPTQAPQDGGAARGTDPDRRRYIVLVLVTGLVATGAMGTFTYITPFLLDVSGFGPEHLSVLLLVFGAAGIVGTVGVARFLDRYPWGVQVALLALLAAALLGLHQVGGSRVGAMVAVALAGLSFSALATALLSRALRVAPGSTDIATAGYSSVFNLGIAAGSFAGALLVASDDVRAVPLLGGVLVTASLLLMVAEPRLARPVSAGR